MRRCIYQYDVSPLLSCMLLFHLSMPSLPHRWLSHLHALKVTHSVEASTGQYGQHTTIKHSYAPTFFFPNVCTLCTFDDMIAGVMVNGVASLCCRCSLDTQTAPLHFALSSSPCVELHCTQQKFDHSRWWKWWRPSFGGQRGAGEEFLPFTRR